MYSRLLHLARIIAFITLSGIVPAGLKAQENSIPLEFAQDPSRNTVIGAFHRQQILYGSLTDITGVLGLRTYENTVTRKLDISQPPYRIKLTAGSPFVVFTDVNGRQTVYQLRHEVISAAGAFFVPLNAFAPLFQSLLNVPIRYENGALRVSATVVSQGFDIPTIQLEQKTNGLLIRIRSSKPLSDYESWLRKDGWLYITIADARADTTAINDVKPVGLVRNIVAIQSPTAVQLTFRLAGTITTTDVLRDNSSNDLLVTIHTPPPEEKATPERKQRDIHSGLEQQRKRWELDVIVVDAGHGGYDPGSIGVGGIREKDITLGIALKLGRLIKKNLTGVAVVYTRTDDHFVQLDRRGQIANEAGGKLFISIHANSMRRKPNPTQGFEVYLLRPGRTEEAIAIAERENAVIQLEEKYEERYKELTEENFILVTMAQSAYVKASEVFADLAQQELEATTGLPNRGVKQAGFYVLVGAAMPNVLVETAYLSNKHDEKFLKSEPGQQKIAEALFRAIKKYKKEYEKLLTEGKNRAQD